MILAGKVILVLEDEPIIAMALEELLESEGARTVMAGSIEVALEELESGESFDAAILDINVHGRKSYPVGSALRTRGVPFVFASGYGDALNPAEFDDIPTLTKPYDLAAIMRALDAAAPGRFGGKSPA